MKPKRGTIQWLAPHLSDGEVQAIYELVLSEVIGEDDSSWSKPTEMPLGTYEILRAKDAFRAAQRKELSRLFGKETG